MGAMGHTWVTFGLLVGLSQACSFDTTNALFDEDLGGGVGNPDASQVAPDAGQVASVDAAPTADAAPPIPMGTLGSFPLVGELELDGVLDSQWLEQEFHHYDIDESQQLLFVHANYLSDASIRFASLYDSENLYFFIEVKDDQLVSNSTSVFNDDSIEIYIDGLNDNAGPYANDDHHLVIGPGGSESFGPASLQPQGTILQTDEGYNVEISIELEDLGGVEQQKAFGFNIAINDDDGLGNTEVDAYGLWYLPEAVGCTDCCDSGDFAWCDTTRLGQLALQD